MKSKKCFKCGRRKLLNKFYVHPQMGDGYLGKCKDCTKRDSKARELVLRKDPDFVMRERARGREKHKRLGYGNKYKPSPKRKREAIERYKARYPEKLIVKSLCGKMKVRKGFNNHHWSYNAEHAKDVIELSIKNHNKLHRYLVYDQERKMYRRIDNMMLLDTKKSHIAYFESIKHNT